MQRRRGADRPAVERRAIPLTMSKVADELDDIVRRARRLNISRRDPHAFHEEKDGICRDLRRLADEARDAARERGRTIAAR